MFNQMASDQAPGDLQHTSASSELCSGMRRRLLQEVVGGGGGDGGDEFAPLNLGLAVWGCLRRLMHRIIGARMGLGWAA